MTSANSCVNSAIAKSWFSTTLTHQKPQNPQNSKNISSQSLMCSSQKETGKESKGSKKPKPNSIRKIRLYPNKEQKLTLQKIYGANRWTYNKIVEDLGDVYSKEAKLRESEVRKFATKYKLEKMNNVPDFINDAPVDALDSAHRDIYKARKSSLKLAQSQHIRLKKFKFRTRKDRSQSIEIRARCITSGPNYIRFWSDAFGFARRGQEGIFIKESLPTLKFACRLQKTRTGRYYICIPMIRTNRQARTGRLCSLDPGVRTFMTLYDPVDCKTIDFGTNFDRIYVRLQNADKMNSRLRGFKGKRNKRWQLRRRYLNILGKIRRMIKDCHHSITSFLEKHYDYVVLPEFETKQMTQKKNTTKRSVLRSKTCRSMLTWSHYPFKKLLRYKMNRSGKSCPENVTEEYTSKCCSRCGRINHKLSSQKHFVCPFCRYSIDRDINGARNIFLKHTSGFFVSPFS